MHKMLHQIASKDLQIVLEILNGEETSSSQLPFSEWRYWTFTYTTLNCEKISTPFAWRGLSSIHPTIRHGKLDYIKKGIS